MIKKLENNPTLLELVDKINELIDVVNGSELIEKKDFAEDDGDGFDDNEYIRGEEVIKRLKAKGYTEGKTTKYNIRQDQWFRPCGRCGNPTCWVGAGGQGGVTYIAAARNGRASLFSAGPKGCLSWNKEIHKLKQPSF